MRRARACVGCRESGGYTLIEVATVLAIMTLLMGLSMPLFTGLRDRIELGAAADHLRSDLGEARTQALLRSRPVYVSFSRSSDGWQWCWGLSLSTSCDCTQLDPAASGYCHVDVDAVSAQPVLRVVSHRDHPRVQLSALAFGGVLRFSPLRPETLAGNADFAAGARRARVVGSSYGRLRLCSPTGAAHLGGLPAC